MQSQSGKIGMIFHWGLYSIPAFDDIGSARRRSQHSGGGSEWLIARLQAKETDFRPPSGWKQAQTYIAKTFSPSFQYQDLIPLFEKIQVDFDHWMITAKSAGASYVILTARHHDGYVLDKFVEKFGEVAKKHGLKWGIYYSWIEFNKPFTQVYMKTVVEPQLNQFKLLKPDIWWFDGHWNIQTIVGRKFVSQFVQGLKEENPHVEINDRLSVEYKQKKNDLDWLGDATFRNFEDRYLPLRKPTVPWEHITTIGLSWGRNLQQEERDYKTGKELYALYEKVVELGGRFLINLGPDGNGELDPMEVKCLQEFAGCFKSN